MTDLEISKAPALAMKTELRVGDLVYIHKSHGPLPVDLFAVVTQVKEKNPNLDWRYPPINIELRVFDKTDRRASYYTPEMLLLLEKDWEKV